MASERVDVRPIIYKLGHSQNEVRERALDNITKKVEYGIVSELDLACDCLLFTKLLEWFNKPNPSKQKECLCLLLRLCSHECGVRTLCSIGGVDFLTALKPDLAPDIQLLVNDILEQAFINSSGHLQASAPKLSYQKIDADCILPPNNTGLSNASAPNQASAVTADVDTPQRSSSSDLKDDWYSQPEMTSSGGAAFFLVEFPWIALNPTDLHVLESTNQSLLSGDHQLIVSSCEFLTDVMFYDFPAEIFLQRPLLVKTLVHLLRSLPDQAKVLHVKLSVVETLKRLAASLFSRIHFHQDPLYFAPKQDNFADSVDTASSHGTSYSRLSAVGISDDKDEQRVDSLSSRSTEDQRSRSTRRSVSVQITSGYVQELELQHSQLLLPDFILLVYKAALSVIETSNPRFELALLSLFAETQKITKLSLTNRIWCDSSAYARDICDKLRNVFNAMSKIALKSHQLPALNSSTSGSVPASRMKYLILSQISLELYSLIPPDQLCDVLGASERQLLYSLCCDESLAYFSSKTRDKAAFYLQNADVGAYGIYEVVMRICSSIDHNCQFLLEINNTKDAEDVLKLANYAAKALDSLPYHMNKDIVLGLINLCCQSWKLIDDNSKAQSLLMSVLLKYLSYPIASIRKEAYMCVISVIKSCLTIDKPSPGSADSIRFVLHPDLLWEVACFGLSSEIAEIVKSSQEIFSYLMQCRLLVTEAFWKIVCQSLLPVSPILQSFSSPDTVLGKCVLAFIDESFENNMTGLNCIKGAIRILFSRDSASRRHATKVLMGYLNRLFSSHLLYPITEAVKYQDHVIRMDSFTREQSADLTQRSVLNEESISRVMRVMLSDGVEQSIKLTSLNQLSVLLLNPLTHSYFLSQDGLNKTLSFVKQGVLPDKQGNEAEEFIPPAVAILANLLQYNQSIRETLSADANSLLTVLRCCWMFPVTTRSAVEAAQCLAYVLFDEVSLKQGNSSLFSMPKTCTIRYKFPLPVLSYCDISAHRVEVPPTNDPVSHSLPSQAIRIHWNMKWHGNMMGLLESLDSNKYTAGSDKLKLTAEDMAQIRTSIPAYSLLSSLKRISNATSHKNVLQEIDVLMAYSVLCHLAGDDKTLVSITWTSYFERFLTVYPIAPADKELLLRIISFLTTLSEFGIRALMENLVDYLRTVTSKDESVLLSLVLDSSYLDADADFRRPLQAAVLNLLTKIGTDQSDSRRGSLPGIGSLVSSVLRRLTNADASNFYNLASLESSVITLLHLTSSPGWSAGCVDLDSRSLCSQLIKALLEVLSAFHVGRQGNALSYMGKGVLRNATLCLRHVCEEMTSVVQEKAWISPYLATADTKAKLDCIKSLWTYRDQEVRAAAMCVSVAMCHNPNGLVLLSPFLESFHDIIMIVIDTSECCAVRQQAALLLSNTLHNVIQSKSSTLSVLEVTLMDLFKVIETSQFVPDMLATIASDLFIDTRLSSAGINKHIRPDIEESLPHVTYPTIAVPSLIGSMVEILVLCSSIIPEQTMNLLYKSDSLPYLTRLFVDDSVMVAVSEQVGPESLLGQILKKDVIEMCSAVVSLLRSCAVSSEMLKAQLIANPQHLLDVLHLSSRIEGFRNNSPVIKLWCEILQYLSALLYMDGPQSMEKAVKTVLLKHMDLLKDVSVHILKQEKEDRRIVALEFWAITCRICYEVSDDSLIVQSFDCKEESPQAQEVASTGEALCDAILPLYDNLLLRYNDKDCIQERLVMMNCLKYILGVSNQAKAAALKAGMVESLLSHIDHFLTKLNMMTTQKQGAQTESSVLLAEIIVSLELLNNFMASSSEVKVAMSEVGIANLVHRMWVYCESDAQLLLTALSALITYTEKSTLACRHMVCTSSVSCLNMDNQKLQLTSNSLAFILVRLTCSHVSRLHLDLDVLTSLVHLMCNFCLSPDTLSVICKSNLAESFSSCIEKLSTARKPKLQIPLTKLFLKLFLNLSYSAEGQEVIVDMKDFIRTITDHVTCSDNQIKEMALIILYNLTVVHKSKVLVYEDIPLTITKLIEDPSFSPELIKYATSILQAIVYNSMKGKTIVKNLSIPERLQELVNGFKQIKRTKHISVQQLETLGSLQSILCSVND